MISIRNVAGAMLALPLLAAAQDAPPAAQRPAAAVPAILPAEDFAELPFIQAPILSPDGTKIALKISANGVQTLAIMSLVQPDKVIKIGTGDADLNSVAWVNEDWLVARIGAMKSVDTSRWYIRRALGIKADGSKFVQLGKDGGQNADDILWIARDGTPRILMAMQTSIYANDPGFWPMVREFDVSTGRVKVVQRSTSNVMDWHADGTGTVRMGVSYDDSSRGYRLLYRDAAGQNFRTVSKARGSVASLGDVPAMFLAEPGKALAFSDDDGFDALYEFDLATLKIGRRLFGTSGYDLDGLITDATRGRVVGVHYTDTVPRTHWLDPEMARVQAEIDKSVGARQARIVSWNRDFSTLLIWVGTASRPGAYYIYRLSEGTMRLFGQVAGRLKPGDYAPVSTINYKARDGLDIQAVLTLPKGRAAKDLPLILMPHGGPAARDDESWDWWAQFLANRGYAVLQPNYRGSTGFGTAFLAKGKGQWGLAMQDDLTDAVKWATSRGIADAKRVCIVGGSYGGYAALRAAQRDQSVYRCAVSFAGVSDMPAILRYDASFLNGNRSKDYLRSQAPDLKLVSPINHAAEFSIPLLMVHGKLDTVVPVDQSRDMASRLKAADKPFRYVEQPKGDHQLKQQSDRLQFLKELETFLREHNPA